MLARRLALSLVALALLAVAPTASATTQPAAVRPVTVLVSNTAVTFSTKKLERGTIAQFYVRNRSKSVRQFVVGVQRTSAIKPGKDAVLLVHVDRRGKVAWRVLPTAAKFRGTLTVF